MSNNVLNKAVELAKMCKKHKEAFFDTKKECATKKIELLKKQHGDKADLHIAALEDVQKNGYSPELVKKCLEKKIALCEKHAQEWADLCKCKEEKMKSVCEKNKQEVEAFKKSL